MNYLELIVKDGTVRVPSIFMFGHYDEVVGFVDRALKQNCTVVFENERETFTSEMNDSDVRYKLLKYAAIISNREVGNAYLRYIGDIDRMTWDKVK